MINTSIILIFALTKTGFALGSVEGRVAIQYVSPVNPKDNFTFKCHRSNGVQNGYQDIYPVSSNSFVSVVLCQFLCCRQGIL